MQKIADADERKVPAVIDDPSTLSQISEALGQAGYTMKRESQISQPTAV